MGHGVAVPNGKAYVQNDRVEGQLHCKIEASITVRGGHRRMSNLPQALAYQGKHARIVLYN
jgi:hypothetical protein